jgi:hypothetical protein
MLKVIKNFLLYILYWLLTQKERTAYKIGMLKGMRVVSLKHDCFGSDVVYDPSSKPVKNYLDWKQFKAFRESQE